MESTKQTVQGVTLVAIAIENGAVSEHFGYCEGFNVYQVKDGEMIRSDYIRNPGHQPGRLPALLQENNVQVVIAGGMGQKAVDLFGSHHMDVITGASGNPNEVLARYLDGSLLSTGSVCHEHRHEPDCHSG